MLWGIPLPHKYQKRGGECKAPGPEEQSSPGDASPLRPVLSSAARALAVDVISEVLSQAQLEAAYAIGLFCVSIYSALWYRGGIRRLALTEIMWWKC